MALDLDLQGIPVLLLDDDDTVSIGSRGVCYAKRALEILDRYGVGDAVCAKGVSWNVGRTFFRESEVYNFNLVPQPDHQRPGMINLQQYYLEEYLVRAPPRVARLDLRWKNKVVSVAQGDGRDAEVETPDGMYTVEADWLIVADGARSPIRRMLNLEVEGKIFMDRFLIADVVMKADFPPSAGSGSIRPSIPTSRCCCTSRPTTSTASTSSSAGMPTRRKRRSRRTSFRASRPCSATKEREFELEWVSVYTFQCRRMAASTTAACSSSAMPRIRCRPSARAAPIPGLQDSRQPVLEAQAGARWQGAAACSTAIPRSASSPPTKT
jgi:3-(3-hydroxy-phenyl)propionate hydroxylase